MRFIEIKRFSKIRVYLRDGKLGFELRSDPKTQVLFITAYLSKILLIQNYLISSSVLVQSTTVSRI